MKKLLTPAKARAWLSHQGISVAQWAREHSFTYSLTLEVLSGRKPCRSGMSHNIALALGMKDGIPTTRPGRVTPAPGKPRAAVGPASQGVVVNSADFKPAAPGAGKRGKPKAAASRATTSTH